MRDAYQRETAERRARQAAVLRESRCPILEVRTDRSYLPELIRYFSSRRRRGRG